MPLSRFRASVLYLLVTLVCTAAAAQSAAFPSNEDLRQFRAIGEPRLSPDGHHVLFRVSDATAAGGRSHLWLTDLAANTTRQLTFSPPTDKRGEHHGDWMPDGSAILFLAKRGEHTQLYRLPMNGGEAQPFDLKVLPTVDTTKLPGYINTGSESKTENASPQPMDVSNFAISPSGKWIAILAKDPESPAEKKQRDDKADANWVDHDIHGTHLYLLDPETSKLMAATVPPNVVNVAWSADSSRLLVITSPQNHLDDLGPSQKAYLVETSNPAQAAQLEKLPATISNAAWSHDGRVIYFLAQAQRDTPPGYLDLYEYNLATQAIRNLTDGFSGSIEHEPPIPLANGGVLKAVATGVNTTAVLIKPGPPSPELLRFPTALAGSFNTNARQTGWVFLGTSSTKPLAIYYTDSFTQAPRSVAIPKLTPANDRTVQSQVVHYASENFTIEGLIYLPPETATKKVPLIVDVHGGPSGAFQDGYDPFVAYLNGQGWAVFRANIRGSSNYGAEFVASNKNDLGGGDYRDLMNGVDYILKNFPVDPNRMALIGYSYGGEMAGFVEGKTNRFKAIVSGAPVIDQFSEYGTEDGSWYDRWYFGKPWERFEDAWRQSPLAGAAKASTPFLLLQGEADKTDPLGESQQMYRALRQMGVPVELVTYPREDHGPLAGAIFGRPSSEPWHGFDARRRMVEFIRTAFDSVK
jgi:dipeptidyl aminopeptidase/acylaminoacyl peptidase